MAKSWHYTSNGFMGAAFYLAKTQAKSYSQSDNWIKFANDTYSLQMSSYKLLIKDNKLEDIKKGLNKCDSLYELQSVLVKEAKKFIYEFK